MPLHIFREPPPTFENEPVSTAQEVDALLIKADQTLMYGRRNAGVIAVALMRIIKANSALDFWYLELRYRALDSDTYLVARPERDVEQGFGIKGFDGKLRPYWLWTGVNGEDEAMDMLRSTDPAVEDFDTLRARNLVNLANAGFLFIRSH